MKKKGFVICTVRNASAEYKEKLEDFVLLKESEGWDIHLPHRDTDQTATGYDICLENFHAIGDSDKIFIFYNPESQGTHFDMGMVFALTNLVNWLKQQSGGLFQKEEQAVKIEVIETVPFGAGKSYARMLTEWEEKQK